MKPGLYNSKCKIMNLVLHTTPLKGPDSLNLVCCSAKIAV